MKTHNEAKTDKKGHYVTSMKPATYSVTVTVDGKIRDQINAFQVRGWRQRRPARFQSESTGPRPVAAGPRQRQLAGRKKPTTKAAKEREAQLAKNKELNDSFGAGKAALDNKQWDEAITQLTKASEIGPTQTAVWAGIGRSIPGQRKVSQRRRRQEPIFDKAFAAFDKLLTCHRTTQVPTTIMRSPWLPT